MLLILPTSWSYDTIDSISRRLFAPGVVDLSVRCDLICVDRLLGYPTMTYRRQPFKIHLSVRRVNEKFKVQFSGGLKKIAQFSGGFIIKNRQIYIFDEPKKD
jgi:hypothetical protein